MDDLYILVNNEPTGPFSIEQLKAMLEDNEIPTDTLFARGGMATWEPLSNCIGMPGKQEIQNQIPPDTLGALFAQFSASFETLATFRGAGDWKCQVADILKKLPGALQSLDRQIAAKAQELSEAKRQFQEQSFLKRAFGSHQSEAAIAQQINNLQCERNHLIGSGQELQQKSDLLPDSRPIRDILIKEIRSRIKELKIEKKQAAMSMTEIRRDARVASDGAGKDWLGLYDSSLAARERRGIRHAKENALQPYENAKENLERQILFLEKRIIWLERLE